MTQRSLKRPNIMPRTTPEFWYRANSAAPSVEEILLAPFGTLYQFAHRIKLKRTQTAAVPIPVICVGNLSVGGSGKTPTCIALNALIKKHKLFKNPYFLTRGYGGHETGPRRITVHDDANAVGDEPLVLLKHSNTIISRDRYDGACHAHDLDADCILMDDGLQNMSLKKDISFIVVNGKMGFGNGKTLPSGPLREPLDFALPRIDGVILIGEDERNIQQQLPADLPVFKASIQPDADHALDTAQAYFAFCGLGYPKKFYDTLRAMDLNIVDHQSFPDHHSYDHDDLDRLRTRAAQNNATLITTEKDYVRVPDAFRKEVTTLPVHLALHDESEMLTFLTGKLGALKEQ